VIDMDGTVVYASRYRNTRRIVEAIAGVLRSHGGVRLLPVEEAAAAGIAARRRRSGARVVEPEGSFLVTRQGPELEPGQLERAVAWAETVAAATASARAPARA